MSSSKIALVTGASRGIGKQITALLLQDDYTVIACCMKEKNAEQLHQDFSTTSNKFIVKNLDLRDAEAISDLRKELETKISHIDVIINNAGVMDNNPAKLHKQTVEGWDNTLDTNLRAPFLICKEMLSLMNKSSNGKILNISGGLGSFSSGMTGGTHGAYRISKIGINALSLILSEELRDEGIHVVAVDPGWVRTDLGGPDAPKSPKQAAQEIIDTLNNLGKTIKSGTLVKESKTLSW
ncbi:MAG TPA: SDR family NAD(P)-dependent oxidoreductase [Gammaproteobacteria bacterium]|nr:SDR family NAD(P)-dependent oxidoreductase [Gammaproteobacteria bacterium]